MDEAEVRQMRATYYGLMSEVDDQIGRVFKFLKDTGQWDNTLVVLTSDHGELFGEGGCFGHGPVPHEKVLEVPFVEGRVGPHLRG
jgi:arylsulfatase A-like enzyme